MVQKYNPLPHRGALSKKRPDCEGRPFWDLLLQYICPAALVEASRMAALTSNNQDYCTTQDASTSSAGQLYLFATN
jgi:hypothetical protein